MHGSLTKYPLRVALSMYEYASVWLSVPRSAGVVAPRLS